MTSDDVRRQERGGGRRRRAGRNALPFLGTGVSHDLGALVVYGRRAGCTRWCFPEGTGNDLTKFCSFVSLINITEQSEWFQTEGEPVSTISGSESGHRI